MSRTTAVWLEGLKSAIAQPIASLVTLVMIAGTVVAVTLTAGRSASGQRDALSTIDAAGTRTITVRVQGGTSTEVLGTLTSLDSVACAAAFSRAVDATNDRIGSDGTPVPTRTVYATAPTCLGLAPTTHLGDDLFRVSPHAEQLLGMRSGIGALRTTEGAKYGSIGTFKPPDFLTFLGPIALRLAPSNANGTAELFVVVVNQPNEVAGTASLINTLLNNATGAVEIQTSERLASVRNQVGRQLDRAARGLLIGILTTTTVLMALIINSLVMMRRRDYGRRRALGASRTLIICLVLSQTTWMALAGTVVGTSTAYAILMIGHQSLPGARFSTGIAILATACSLVASIAPSITASRRDPLKELRVP